MSLIATSAGVMFAGESLTDAQKYIAAVESTGYVMPQTEKDAVTTLIAALKTNGTWAKKYAIYLFSGNTAASQKWNLKDPRDLDAARRLVFSGGMTHSAMGIKGNGVDAFANTFVSIDELTVSPTGDAMYSIYSRTSDAGTDAYVDMGWYEPTSGRRYFIHVRLASFSNAFYYIWATPSLPVYMNVGTSVGLFEGKIFANEIVSYWNGIKQAWRTVSPLVHEAFPTGYIYLATVNSSSGPVAFSAREYAYAAIGQALTDAEVTADYNAISAYLLAVGRFIDSDAQSYIAAVESTGYVMPQIEKDAVNTYVRALKVNGTWAKKIAVYLISGNTAASQKWNLKDPRDLDAAKRIVWHGGTSHAGSGVQFNGVDAYGDTFVTANELTSPVADMSYGVTSLTNTPGSLSPFRVDMGLTDTVSGTSYQIAVRNSDTLNLYYGSNSFIMQITNTSSVGSYVGSYLGTVVNIYKNGVAMGAPGNHSPVQLLQPQTAYIGATRHNTSGAINFSDRLYGHFEFGRGLTPAEILADYNALRAYMVAIGRVAAFFSALTIAVLAFLLTLGIELTVQEQIDLNELLNATPAPAPAAAKSKTKKAKTKTKFTIKDIPEAALDFLKSLGHKI